MPYQLEKGPTLSVAESMLNGSYEHRAALLELMRAGTAQTPSDALPTLNSTTLDHGPLNTQARRIDHMNSHWFGKRKQRGMWTKQAPFDPDAPRATGFWNQWHGDAEGILREAFTRALEVAIGIDHGADIPPDPVHDLPVQIFWRCPAPWMEAWVTWVRATAPAAGVTGIVTVHVHTPSHDGSALLLSPRRGAPDNASPDYRDDPRRASAAEGMWVVTHEQHVQWPFYSTVSAQRKGSFQLPTFGPFVEGRGQIVTVQISEKDGGVLTSKRPYVPA
jgi:hypothetical protein